MARRIILAGGGTAGHIEPALAVADSLRKIDSKLELEFLGTSTGLEQLLVPQRGYLLRAIPKVVLPRKISLAAILFPFKFIGGVFKARKIVKGADLLIGFGGYVSATAYLAARLAGVSIALHEANARPGWANRLGRHFAKVVAVNFENVRSDWSGSILTGMPIRKAITEVAHLSETERKKFRELHATTWGFDSSRPIVAIFGGSQGSLQINEAVASYLKNPDREIQILHAVGSNNPLPAAAPNYLPMAYFHDMASIYLAADLLLTRSGAVTCAEIQSTNSSAILVPLPHGNGEQFLNAHELEEEGFAIVVNEAELKENWLQRNLSSQLEKARSISTARNTLHQNAADQIANLVLKSMRVAD